MMVMEEFQKVYIVASIYRAIFAKAIQMVCPETRKQDASQAPGTTGLGEPVTQQQPLQGPDAAAPVFPGPDLSDMVDALMDESLPFNFWEAWNDIDGFGVVYPDAQVPQGL
jgi:hypothetical protein